MEISSVPTTSWHACSADLEEAKEKLKAAVKKGKHIEKERKKVTEELEALKAQVSCSGSIWC